MRAVTLNYQTRSLRQREVPDPVLARDTQVLFRILEVGVCGTDRELANFRFGEPPAGEEFLILGHEALGEVIAAGSAVHELKPGDLVVPTVRRACVPACVSCARSRRDLCVTGAYTERGILQAHGYFADFAVDEAADLIRIPAGLAGFGVLVEPLSVVEKAIQTALRIHEPGVGSAIVTGAGPIGILAALALQLRGIEVTVASLEPENSPRAALIREAGIRYTTFGATAVKADIVIEATGAPSAALQSVRMLRPLGTMIALGACVADGRISFLDLVVHNQTIAGSVNASPESFAQAVDDLGRFPAATLRAMIHRVPLQDFENSILGPPDPHPKLVHTL
ncbi:MAG: alcohol dehydrogenase catalytic domain-containing protein [Bryobacteraceae bacterium]